ncbi:MAG: glutamyl-tRNA reductase [Ruminococcus sp.]|nr:glutamyl-tRNA reductase [Ruminococcus sp.]
MNCTSINYKLAPQKIRSQLALSKSEQVKLIEKIKSSFTNECVMLCTCNRTEIYFEGEYWEEISHVLSKIGNFEENELGPYVMRFCGHQAIEHLFSLAAGLDSMVIGEDEILRQLKEAYENANECGCVSSQFNMIFQTAFACAKKIKTSTSLSTIPVSIATLAANAAAKFTNTAVNALVIGATGKIGLSTLKNLIAHKNVTAYATTRSRNRDIELAKELGVKLYDFSDRYKLIDKMDCVISATNAPHYTLNYNEIDNAIKEEKSRLFIDLAVPPDIDSHVKTIEGVKLLTIDDFKNMAEQNNKRKEKIALSAKEIIHLKTNELEKELAYHSFQPTLNQICERQIDARKLIITLKSSLEFSQFDAVLTALSKLLEEQNK